MDRKHMKLYSTTFLGGPLAAIFLGGPTQGRCGTAQTRGTASRFMARPGPENLGADNLGTARPAKYWHGKTMARHGTEKFTKIEFGSP